MNEPRNLLRIVRWSMVDYATLSYQCLNLVSLVPGEIIAMDELFVGTGIEEVHKHSTWFLLMGGALIIIGCLAIGSAAIATLVSMLLLGWLLFIAGMFEIVHGFARR